MAISVGSIYVEIKGDYTQWKKDMSSLRSEATKSGKEVSDALNSAINPTQASAGIRTIATSLTQLAQTAKVPQEQFKQTADAITNSFGDVADKIGMTRQELSRLNEQMLRNKAFQTATNELKSLTNAAGLSVSETKKLAVQMGYTSSQAGEMANKIHNVKNETSGSIDVFSRFAVMAASAFSVHELIAFTDKIVKAGVELQSLEYSMTAITGSSTKAGKEIAFVNSTAKSLGVGLSVLEQSYKGLLAASQGTNIEGEATQKIFTAVSKASAVLGLSADQTSGALLALEQMISKGTVQSEELRGQLGERLPGAFQMAAEAIGVTTAELSDMLREGEVISDEFLPKFADVLENRFGKAAEDAGNQARGAFENFKTAVLELKRTLAESGIVDDLAKIAQAATAAIDMVNESMGKANASLKVEKTMSGYEAAISKANAELSEFTKAWGDTEDVIPQDLLYQFEKLTANVEKLETARDELAKGLRNESDWKTYRDQLVNTFGEHVTVATTTIKEIEAAEKKSYEKSTSYLLTEKKKQLAIYLQYEGKKPEYVAQLQSEIAALEKKANASTLVEQKKAISAANAEQKKATAAYKHELEEQLRAVEAFNEDYKSSTMSTFDYEVDQLDTWYDKQLTLVEKGLISREKLEEAYAAKYDDLYDKEMAAFTEKEEKKTAAAQKAKEEIIELEKDIYEKEKEYAEKAKEQYDKLYEKAYDFTRDVIDDFDDMGNTLVDLAENMVKDIAAAFLTQTIVMPVYMYAANSLGLSSLISSGSTSSSSALSGSSLASTVSGAYDAYSLYSASTGGTTSTIAKILSSDAVSSVGESVFGSAWGGTETISDVAYIMTEDGAMYSVNAGSAGATYSTGLVSSLSSAGTSGIISSLLYTYLGDYLGLPQGEYSGIGAGVGGAAGYTVGASLASGASSGAASGSWAGPVGAIIGAIVGGVASSFIGSDEPDYRIGLFPNHGDTDWTGSNRVATSDNYSYMIATQDYDVDNATSLFDFYDSVLEVLDEATTGSINDILLNAQTGDYGRIGWFDPSGMETEEILTTMSDDLFEAIRKGLVEDIGAGFDANTFTYDFFEAIQSDSETLLDTYLNFRDSVDILGTEDFLTQFTYQIDDLGLTAAEAYENMQAIASTVDEVRTSVAELSSTDVYNTLNDTVISWQELMYTLEAVSATTSQLTEVENARNESLGSNLTGLTAETLYSNILSGTDISQVISTSIESYATSMIAQEIYDNYISELNSEVGKVFVDSDYDLTAVIDYIQNIDTSEAQAEILALQESFGLIAETATMVAVDTSEAARTVTLAIDGQLSAWQQFAEWGINNAEALSLYEEMIGASVTQDELEGAIDAFVDLGLAGDDLNTVIQDLADRFTDATDQLLQNISDIESAQGDLTGDESSQYLSDIAEVFSYFTNTPSLSQIRGDETVTQTYFDEEAYKKAFYDYVVDSEFETILGHSASGDYWTNALMSGDVSLSSLSDAIVNGISSNEDIVAEIFNRLFGRSPSSDYWEDALNDVTSGITASNIEQAILSGASSADLAYYNEHNGVVDITDWMDFSAFDTLQEHLDQYARALDGFSSSDFTYTQSVTVGGEYSTSEEEVLSAIATLNDLPEVITNGLVNESALSTFVDTIGSMDASVLEDIFGADAADQITSLASAVSDYYDASTDASESTDDYTDSVSDAADALAKQRELEIDILYAQGESEAALAMEREDAIAELESTYGANADTLIDLQEELWALNDAAEAAALSEEILSEERSLQIDILEAQGDAETALAMEREDTISSLTESYGDEAAGIIALQEELWALNDAAEAAAEAEQALSDAESERNSAASEYQSALQDELSILENDLADAKATYLDLLNDELSAQEELADTMRDAADSLKEYRESIWAGSDSPNNAETRKDLLYSQVRSLYSSAMSGDTDAMSELISVSSDYLALSKDTSTTWEDYQREAIRMSTIMAEVESYAGEQADSAESQVEYLQSVIDTVNGVDETITDINVARQAYDDAMVAFNENWYSAEIEYLNGILESNKNLETLMANFEAAQNTYITMVGTDSSDDYGFATGGSLEASGQSGIDNLSMNNLRLTAGEITNVSTSDVMGSLLAEIQSLRSQVEILTKAVETGNSNAKKISNVTEKWDRIGTPTRAVA